MDNKEFSTKPIYLKIREDLLTRMQTAQDRRLPSELELCREYKVCRPTVRKALEYFLDADMIVRIPGRGSFLREDPAKKQQRLREMVAIIRSDWESWDTNLYFCSVIQGIMNSLSAGVRLSIEKYSEPLLYRLLSSTESASIWISPEAEELKAVAHLADADRVAVVINREFTHPGVRTVTTDHSATANAVTEAFSAAGAKRFVSMSPEAEHLLSEAIQQGIRERAEQHQMTILRQWVPLRDWRSATAKLTLDLLSQGERNFYLTSQSLLTPFLTAAKHAGLRPGKELTLLVQGDDLSFESLGIAAVRADAVQLGGVAGQMALGKEKRLLCKIPGTLIRRGSLSAENRKNVSAKN
ncbi:MAG: GntR family transcriptional regulator [Victivallaceae bacterium]|nr:GntR family transcriptional regulator [Victivallaceae bacterium]